MSQSLVQVLGRIFDAIFGQEARSLRRYPESLDNVHALWSDALGVEHGAASLEDVQRAYEARETYSVTFTGFQADGRSGDFVYFPGATPPRATASVRGLPENVEAMIAPVREAFPRQRKVVFISWSGKHAERVAEHLRVILVQLLPAGTDVFLSPHMPPGVEPLKEMLDRNLLATDAHLVVMTAEMTKNLSPWVAWEAGASWARRKRVIPIFVDVQANDVPGPMKLLAQGVELGNFERLTAAIDAVAADIAAKGPGLSPEHHRALVAAARPDPDSA